MKKLFKNNQGFSLAEMLVAMAVVGVITTVVISFLKLSNQTVNKGLEVSEVSNLKNLIIQNMSNPTACKNTFGDQNIDRTDTFTLKDKGTLANPGGSTFLAVSPLPKSTFGGERADRPLLTITGIKSNQGSSANSLTLTVSYSLNKNMVANEKQALTGTIVTNIFMVPKSATQVKDCYADVSAMIIAAVKNSCLSPTAITDNAAVYEAGFGQYGRCVHTPKIESFGAAPLLPGICPPGEFFAQTTSNSAGEVTYKCRKFSTTVCDPGEYLTGIDATGNKICAKFYTLFNNGMGLFWDGTNYSSIDLNCGPDMVLRKANPKTCAPKVIIKQCDPGKYISDVDASGNVTCSYFSRKTAGVCPSGQYLRAINSDGSVPVGGCADLGIPGASCAANYVLRGLNADGTPICERTGP